LEWRRKAQHRELRTLPNSYWRRAENKFLQVLVEALMRSAQANAQQNFESHWLAVNLPGSNSERCGASPADRPVGAVPLPRRACHWLEDCRRHNVSKKVASRC